MQDPNGRIGHLLHFTNLIYEHIKLADQKALVFLALDGSLLGGLYGVEVLKLAGLRYVLSVLSCIFLLAAMGSALWTIRPRRGRKKHQEGVIDPARIARFSSSETYTQAFLALDSEQLEAQMLERAFDFSWIDRAKYRWLNAAIVLSALGWALALYVLWQVAGSPVN